MSLVNEAVVQSFRATGWGVVDHHTMLKGFWEWYNKEKASRGYCPGTPLLRDSASTRSWPMERCRSFINDVSKRAGNWKWVVPPINGFLSPCYMKLNRMTEYTVLPQYVYAPGFKAHVKRLQVRLPTAVLGCMEGCGVPCMTALLHHCTSDCRHRTPAPYRREIRVLQFACVIVQAHKKGISRSGSSAERVDMCRRLFFNRYLWRFLGMARRSAHRLRAPLVIAYATVTGTTRNYAQRLAKLLSASFAVELMNVEEFSCEPLKRAAAVVQLTSTYGSGAPPTTARKWLTYLTTAEAKEVRLGARRAL